MGALAPVYVGILWILLFALFLIVGYAVLTRSHHHRWVWRIRSNPSSKEVIVSSAVQELVGREVYSRDGYKVGEIKEVVYDGEYVLIRGSLF